MFLSSVNQVKWWEESHKSTITKLLENNEEIQNTKVLIDEVILSKLNITILNIENIGSVYRSSDTQI